ncbi:MAG TPA: hypothetical protein VN688_07190 [Gemmataceae bacterium]|nr:hypothetical protein [Gemmataceae bacterium]
MRFRVLSVLLLTLAGVTTFSLTQGQDRIPSPSGSDAAAGHPPEKNSRESSTAKPPTPPAAVQTLSPSPLSLPARGSARDFSKLGILQKEMLLSCQGGADWLYRVNGIKGRFLHGYLPALKTEMEGDHYLRQVGGAFALARAARFLGEERYAARATQAILTLLDDTIVDSSDPQCRHTSLPSRIVNRLGAAGMLVLAINELPAPQPDLLDKSEQLCNWIHRQVRADGSLRCNDAGDNDKPEADEGECINEYPGLALYAVLRSQKHRPAAWKPELARKAAAYYRTWWNAHRNMAFVPWQTAAYAEAYLQTKDAACADFVYEMNDWLCGLQYDQIDPRRLTWYGGFMRWTDGKAADASPDISSAAYAESLAEACRAARAGSDVARHQRYTEVMERGLQFVVRLQYTDANVQHFADWYRPRLVGAFHASPRDGNLRLDYTQHALSALTTYLEDADK